MNTAEVNTEMNNWQKDVRQLLGSVMPKWVAVFIVVKLPRRWLAVASLYA